MYQVCLIHENKSSPDNPETYPYRDVVLVRGKSDHVYRFPSQKGDIREKFEIRSKEVRQALSTIPPGMGYEVLGSEKMDGQDTLILLCSGSSATESSITDPTIIDAPNSCMRILMDEIRQGRVCHLKIHSTVRNLFFTNNTDPKGVKPYKPYFYEPGSKLLPKEVALVRCGDDTPMSITHNKGYYKIPICGYHGTTEYALSNIYKNGLEPTTENGMYGNDMYYFGNFYKAIRYSFRTSSFATMNRRHKLPTGSIEIPNTGHVKSMEKDDSKDVMMDLARDCPILVRFVVFIKESMSLPRDMKNKSGDPFEIKDKRILKKTSNSYITYVKDKEGPTRKIFNEDQLKEQLDKERSVEGSFIRNLSVAETFSEDVPLPEESSRETVLKNLYEKIHIATRDAFA